MRCVTAALVLAALLAAGGEARGQSSASTDEQRPATASFWGDTGLWFVPTADVLPSRSFSLSLYRTELDFNQGFSDVSYWPATAGVGIGNRLEVFGALRTVTRIDRDLRPLFVPEPPQPDGGLLDDHPFVDQAWTGNQLGDLFLGGKINLLSQYREQPIALAFRGTVKVPTGDEDTGASTGEWDYFADAIVSREIGRRVELTGFGGYALRGNPEGLRLSDGFRWGAGAAWGARANLRLTTELYGEVPFENDIVAVSGLVVATDGSVSPILTELDSTLNAAVGLTWQASNGLALGVGMNYRFGLDNRSDVSPAFDDETADAIGLQVRVGFHGGVNAFALPAPPAPPAPPMPPAPEPVAVAPPPEPPPAPVNAQPTIDAQCDPCTIEVGKTVTIRAQGRDPDGDAMAYRWSTSAGTIKDPRAADTAWTAETVPGPVVLTVVADDGRGGTASDTVTVQVTAAATREILFDDVHFDLDQATLRPEAMQELDEVIKAMNENRTLRIEVEGHTCNLGTDEHNMALGEHRATAAREYLTQRGISGTRIRTVSYGEARPKYSNGDEEHRRLNRRVALIVRLQETTLR